jgi:MFS transporter, DHA1 family, multidrug resistance protein
MAMSAAGPYAGKTASSVIWVLGMLAAFGPMSIDMYLPSLPTIARDLDATTGEVQLTLSAFFIGSALGQLVYGTLSDRVGRRPVLIGGISLYIVTSGLCALSTSVEALIAFRFLHALGSGAGTVVSRAVVRDLFDTTRAARTLSLMVLVMGGAPLLAPLVGGQILIWFGWRAIFGLLTAFGVTCLLAVLFRLPESNPPEQRAVAGISDVLKGFSEILTNRTSLGCILTNGFAFAGMFAYISGTPFVYIRYFGVSPEYYGFLFGLNVVGLMGGAAINARLVVRIGLTRMKSYGVLQLLVGGMLLVIAGATGAFGLAGIVGSLFIYISALNPIGANAMAQATEPFPQRAGATAALFGTTQFLLGALAGTAVGQFHDGTPFPMAATIGVCGLCSMLALAFQKTGGKS